MAADELDPGLDSEEDPVPAEEPPIEEAPATAEAALDAYQAIENVESVHSVEENESEMVIVKVVDDFNADGVMESQEFKFDSLPTVEDLQDTVDSFKDGLSRLAYFDEIRRTNRSPIVPESEIL